MTMFGTMVFNTYLVFAGTGTLKKATKLFWTFGVPWKWAYTGSFFPDWVAQFAFGFYSLMLTSTLIGFIVMFLYKERTWCTFCPMGTMTQGICKWKNAGKMEEKEYE
jgi:polyferredoxin